MAKTGYEQKRKHLSDQAWITGLIAQAQNKGWYGDFTIKIHAGEVKRVERKEIIVPPQ